MEEYLIFAAIGGLLFLTLLVNSVAEAYEQKQREKRIKILQIKQGLDELSDLLDDLKNCDISDNIANMIANEIMLRLQTIQTLDRHFKGIQALIAEADAEQKSAAPSEINNNNNEVEFKKKLIKFGRLIRILNSYNWYSGIKTEQLKQYIKDIKLLRCEKIFQFYSALANAEVAKERYIIAKEHYNYIHRALKGSDIHSHPRIIELQEQTEFMLQQSSKMFADKAKKLIDSEELQEENAATIEEKEAPAPGKIENPQSREPVRE
ncbi:MAG: hypothetical protein KAI22_03355 [Gammaproteobacteria bacterium]|nr:hypothetical protein [Gammaproteobacteria bacterium]